MHAKQSLFLISLFALVFALAGLQVFASCRSCSNRNECHTDAADMCNQDEHKCSDSSQGEQRFAGASEKATIEVFHKSPAPAMQTLERTNEVLDKFVDEFSIAYHEINQEETKELIDKYSLPGTHFPFAIFINGKSAAEIDGEKIVFFDFPKFMHGIGRHEGNWSMLALEKVLNDTSLLISDNLIPEPCDCHEGHSDCLD